MGERGTCKHRVGFGVGGTISVGASAAGRLCVDGLNPLLDFAGNSTGRILQVSVFLKLPLFSHFLGSASSGPKGARNFKIVALPRLCMMKP